jgi:hypothetical protein
MTERSTAAPTALRRRSDRVFLPVVVVDRPLVFMSNLVGYLKENSRRDGPQTHPRSHPPPDESRQSRERHERSRAVSRALVHKSTPVGGCLFADARDAHAPAGEADQNR